MILTYCISVLTCLYVSVVMYLLLSKFFERRDNISTPVYIISIVVVSLLLFLSNYIFYGGLMNAVGMFIPVLLASLLFKGRITTKFIVSVLGILLIGISEIIIMFLAPMICGMSVSEFLDNQSTQMLGTILSKLLLLAIIKILPSTNKQRNNHFSVSYWILFCLIFLNSILAIFLMFRFSYNGLTTQTYTLSIICSFGLLFSTFFALYMYDHIAEQSNILQKQQQFEQQIEYQTKYLNELLATQNQFRKFRHDLKYHSIALKAYFANNATKEGLAYINKLNDTIDENAIIIDTGNVALDSIIRAKRTLAQSKGIKFNTMLQIPSNIPIDAADICIIFGNALDNAIEACEKLNISDKSISLSLIYEQNSITCKISNTCKNKNTSLKTTKKDSKNHGFGLKNIRLALSKYNHTFSIYQYETEFVLFFVIFI